MASKDAERKKIEKLASQRPLVGILTIGQSPRPDGLAEEVGAALGPSIAAIERGALDDLEWSTVKALEPKQGDYWLVTRLRDGREVRVAEHQIVPLLEKQIRQLEESDQVTATLLLCTGDFPELRKASRTPLLTPHAALFGAVLGMAGGGKIASMTPIPEQAEQAKLSWKKSGAEDVAIVVADPYAPSAMTDVATAAQEAKDLGAEILFLNCFGYSLRMSAIARTRFPGPVVLARTLAGRLMAEMVAG